MPGALEQRTRGEVSLLSRETLSCYGTHFSPWFWHCPSLSLIPSSSLNKITQKRTLKNMCHHQIIIFCFFFTSKVKTSMQAKRASVHFFETWKNVADLSTTKISAYFKASRLVLLSRYIYHKDIFIRKTFHASHPPFLITTQNSSHSKQNGVESSSQNDQKMALLLVASSIEAS